MAQKTAGAERGNVTRLIAILSAVTALMVIVGAVAANHYGLFDRLFDRAQTRTCGAEFFLKNAVGQKVISFKLYQTFSWKNGRVTSLRDPITSVSTKWGWSHDSVHKSNDLYGQGWGWSPKAWQGRAAAGAKFDLKFMWFTLQTYNPTIIVDVSGEGRCRSRGYW